MKKILLALIGLLFCGSIQAQVVTGPLTAATNTVAVFSSNKKLKSAAIGAGLAYDGSTLNATAAVEPDTWTLAVVPDCQYSTNTTQAALAAYLISIRTNRNLKMVMTVGDTVDDASSAAQWANSTNLFHALTNSGLPLLITTGNHDYDAWQWWDNPPNIVAWSGFYGPQFFTNLTWFNGGYYSTNTDNAWVTNRISGQDWLFMSLEIGPRTAVAAWAAGVITNHPSHRVIISTHCYERPEGYRDGVLGSDQIYGYGIHDAGVRVDRLNAEQLWRGYFQGCPNIVAILSGHLSWSVDSGVNDESDLGPGRSVVYGSAGNAVHEIFQNYQGMMTETLEARQGGWVRLYTFTGDCVHVETYSATAATNKFGAVHDFNIDISPTLRVPGSKTINALSEYTRSISLPDPDLADGMFFYVPMNEQWGSNVIDVITGTIGNPYPRAGHALACSFTTNGVRGSGLLFDDWSHVDFGNLPSPQLWALSASLWYWTTNSADTAGGAFVARHNGGADAQFMFAIDPVTPFVSIKLINYIPSPGTYNFTLPQSGNDGVWHHYAFVWDGTNVVAYFDGQALGVPQATVARPLNTSTRSLWLGDYEAMAGGAEWTLRGTLDEVKLWNRALSTTEILYLANKHSHAGADITSGTVGTARLGSGSASGSTYLRGDQTWATPAGTGDVVADASPWTAGRVLVAGATDKHAVPTNELSVEIFRFNTGVVTNTMTASNFTASTTMNSTNGFMVGAQGGIAGTIDVLVSGATTNRLVFVGGILISNITTFSP
jgi:hypothetical protein